MNKISLRFKKVVVCIIEIIYLLGSIGVTFGLWIFFIYNSDWRPELRLELESALKNMVVWVAVPLVLFAGLLELYAKVIKRSSRRLQRYGFIGRRLYSSSYEKSG